MTRAARRSRIRELWLVLLALVLFACFASLGTWQLQRLAWKNDLIARVEAQLSKPPVPAPGPAAWHTLRAGDAYLPVRVAGRYLHAHEAFVQAMTAHGSGYWLLTPLLSERGFIVLVNRGFVDPSHREPASRPDSQPDGRVEVRGLLRLSEPGGRLLQANNPGADRWYSRDVAAIADSRRLAREQVAPYFVDADNALNEGGWPVGGLTVVKFRNAHLGYAITWYALALLTAAGAVLAWRQRA